jgi:hypothetical protein
VSTPTFSATELRERALRAKIEAARRAIADLPPGRQRDNRTARLDIEQARLFPKGSKSK